MHGGSDKLTNNSSSSNQHELRPVLAEILRTCTHSNTIILRVEQIVRTDVTDSNSVERSLVGTEHLKAQSVRLHLSDGQLIVQALLHRQVLETVHAKNLRAGDLLKVYKFSVKRASKRTGDGHVVYLSIERCQFLTAHTSFTASSRSEDIVPDFQSAQVETNFDEQAFDGLVDTKEDLDGGFLRDDDRTADTTLEGYVKPEDHLLRRDAGIGSTNRDQEFPEVQAQPKLPETEPLEAVEASDQHADRIATARDEQATSSLRRFSLKRKNREISVEDEEEDPFETATIDKDTAYERRRALLKFDDHRGVAHAHSDAWKGGTCTDSKHYNIDRQEHVRADGSNDQVTAAKEDDHRRPDRHVIKAYRVNETSGQPSPPPPPPPPEPPLHTLASLLNPPKGHSLPRKNYTLNVLAIVTYVGASLITRPGSSYPAKRHIKIEDASLHQGKYQSPRSKGITVAVYRDAANFKPDVGTVALFRGLVMQRLSSTDIMLNKYTAATATAGAAVPRLSSRPSHANRASLQHQAGFQGTQTEAQDEWFITSAPVLREMGHDVDALQTWWRSRQRDRTK